MKILTYKKDLKSSLPLISLIIGIDLIFIILGTYLPFSVVFVSLIITFPSTVLATFIKKRYYLLYVFTSTILAFLVGIGDISFVIYYFLPSLLISFLFSLGLINKDKEEKIKIDQYLILFVTSFINLFIEITLIYIGIYLFNFNIVEAFLRLFSLENNEVAKNFILMVIFLYSFMNILVSFIFLKFELKRFNNEVSFYESKNNGLYLVLIIVISSIFIAFSNFLFFKWAYLFLFISFLGIITLVFEEARKGRFIILVSSIILLIISLVIIAYLKDVDPLNTFLLINISPLASGIIYLIKRLLVYKFKKIK